MAATGSFPPQTVEDYVIQAILDPSRVAAYDEAKLFAHAAAETQVAIKEEFLLAPSSGPSSSTYPFLNTLGFLEVYPRVPSKPPKLFQELESLLADKLRECEKAAAVTAAQARGRDPNTAANLTMPVYKQVFDAFIMAFQAYAPLLSEIKTELDAAIDEGLQHAIENADLMMKLEECKVQRRAAVEEARRQVAQQELPWRREMAVKLGISRAQCAAADRARDNLRAERDAARKEIARLRGALAELTDANRRLLEQHDAEANWARQPLGPAISKMAVGPITEQDEEEILDGYNISGRKGGAASGRRVTSFRNTDPLRHTASTAASASAAAAAYAATGGGGGGDAGAGGDPSGS